MKLSPIRRENLLQAATDLDSISESLWSEYWVYIPEKNKEYPFKQLVRKAYTHATGVEIGTDFFQSNDGYRQYIEKKFQLSVSFRVRDNIDFFSAADIEVFSEKGGESYSSADTGDQLIGGQLRKTIFSKTNTWARALNLDGFEIIMDNSWQRSGYFARFSWARIFRTGDRDKKIFFTVGVDAENKALIYKLDCHYRSFNPENALNPEQVKVFDRIVKTTNASWQEVPADELQEYNWEFLVEVTRDFIFHYLSLYDEVISAVWAMPSQPIASTDALREQPIPKGTGQLPPRGMRVAYESNADYDSENKNRKSIGDAGESLVIELEKEYLIRGRRPDLAAAIRKVLDWEGYDILSFQINGEPRYVEVKTTTGTATRPFYWTKNEKRTMFENSNNYCLYRLYNYDKESGTADFYKLEGDFSALIIEEAVQYLVHPR